MANGRQFPASIWPNTSGGSARPVDPWTHDVGRLINSWPPQYDSGPEFVVVFNLFSINSTWASGGAHLRPGNQLAKGF